MVINKSIITVCIICVCFLCGCKKDESDLPKGIQQSTEGSSQSVNLNEDSLLYEEMTFKNPETGVFVLAVNEAGDMCTEL